MPTYVAIADRDSFEAMQLLIGRDFYRKGRSKCCPTLTHPHAGERQT